MAQLSAVLFDGFTTQPCRHGVTNIAVPLPAPVSPEHRYTEPGSAAAGWKLFWVEALQYEPTAAFAHGEGMHESGEPASAITQPPWQRCMLSTKFVSH